MVYVRGQFRDSDGVTVCLVENAKRQFTHLNWKTLENTKSWDHPKGLVMAVEDLEAVLPKITHSAEAVQGLAPIDLKDNDFSPPYVAGNRYEFHYSRTFRHGEYLIFINTANGKAAIIGGALDDTIVLDVYEGGAPFMIGDAVVIAGHDTVEWFDLDTLTYGKQYIR